MQSVKSPTKHKMVPTDLLFACVFLVAQDPRATPMGLAVGLGINDMPIASELCEELLPNGVNPDYYLDSQHCINMTTRDRIRTWLGELYTRTDSIESMCMFSTNQSQ